MADDLTVQMDVDRKTFRRLIDLEEFDSEPLLSLFDDMVRVVRAIEVHGEVASKDQLSTITGLNLTRAEYGDRGKFYDFESLGIIEIKPEGTVILGPIFND